MKKSLLALAVLGAFSSVASAQSSVQLFGTLDVNARYLKNDGRDKQYSLGTDGVNSSELRFQGIEDLGGGLKAGFNIRSGFNPDTGTTGSKFWNRRATVSLYTNAGELRLGRDYVPTFWNTAIFDAFGYNGIGSTGNVHRIAQVRQDNAIQYHLPSNLGGWYGSFMAAASEASATPSIGDSLPTGRYLGGQFGFRAGPFDVAVAYSEVRASVGIPAVAAIGSFAVSPGDKLKTFNVGGSWDFGFMKLMGYYDQNKATNGKEKVWSVSGTIPFGQSEVRIGYDNSKVDINGPAADTSIDNIKATYQYNLSKRTAMYGTIARLNNKDNTIGSLPGGGAGSLPTAGGDSKGFEIGVRHFF